MKNKTYVRLFNKIGPVEININGCNANVSSILGVREYEFKLLPNTQNNGYAILRYSLKNYFEEFLAENKPKKYEKKKVSKLNMFLNYFISNSVMLETEDLKCIVYGEMEKNPKHYNWEDVEKFRCVQGGSVIESLKKPLVIGFDGFEEEFFINENIFKINEKAIEKMREERKDFDLNFNINGDKMKLVEKFVNKEIEYLLKLLDYEKEFIKYKQEIFYGDLKIFFDILSSQENIVSKMVKEFNKSIIKIINKEQLEYIENKNKIINKIDFNKLKKKDKIEIINNFESNNINIINICEFIIENFILYLPYINFMNNYEKIIEKYKNIIILRECFSEIIQKITNFPIFFKCMLKYVNDDIVEIAYFKTDKYSKMLHSIANETYLNKELIQLLRDSVNLSDLQEEWDILKMGKLYDKVKCNLLNGKGILLYIFKDYLGIFDDNHICLNIIALSALDFYIFDMRIFLFLSTSTFKSEIFKKLEYSRLHYLVLQTNNKESIYEFKEIFYVRKYNCKVYCNSKYEKDGILYKRKGFCDNDIIFSKILTDSDYNNNFNIVNESINNIINIDKNDKNILIKDQIIKSIDNISLIKENCIGYDNSLFFEYINTFLEECKNSKRYILNLKLRKIYKKNKKKEIIENKWINKNYKVYITVSNFDIYTSDIILNYKTNIDSIKNLNFKLTENQMIDISKYINNKFLKNLQNNKIYLEKIKVLLTNISENRMINYELNAYNEDLVIQDDKIKIFEIFIRLINLKIKKDTNKIFISNSNDKFNSFYYSILYPDDILKKYSIIDTVSYLKEYLLILHSYKQAESILSNFNLEKIIILFSMFMQRNIYSFISPNDIHLIKIAFDTQSYNSSLNIIRKNIYLEKIAYFILPLYYYNTSLGGLILYTFYRTEISESIIYQILKVITLNI